MPDAAGRQDENPSNESVFSWMTAKVQRHEEADAAKQVHDDLAERVGDGLVRSRVGDEQERAGGRDFPAREHPCHVVGEHDDVHGRQEQEHEREERRTAVLALQPRPSGSMLLEVHHVPERIHADAAADDADDERHDDGERVDVEARFNMDA